MNSVVKRRIHFFRHGIEEVGSPNDCLNLSINISEENDRSFRIDDVASAAEGAILHVPLHDVDATLVGKADSRRLIKRHDVPEADETSRPVERLTNI